MAENLGHGRRAAAGAIRQLLGQNRRDAEKRRVFGRDEVSRHVSEIGLKPALRFEPLPERRTREQIPQLQDDPAPDIDAAKRAERQVAFFLLLCLFTDTGLGDLKFAGLIGLTLGARSWGSVFDGFAVAWGIATVWGMVQLLRGRLTSRIPLGPYLMAGTMLTLLWL